MGIALQEQGELLEAIHSYAQAIEIKPESDEAFYNMGVVLKRVRFQNNIPYLPKILILLLSKKTFVNPSDVLFASTSLLKFDPAIRCAMKHQAANEIETLLPEIMTDLSQVQLLTSVMASCPIADLELEALLSKIRSAALFALPKLESTPAILSFQAVLALQCFINEYIYSQTESETQAIYEIEKSIESGLRLGQQPHPTFLACLASYKTLSECSWSHLLNVPDALQELVHMQIYNAEKERRIKSVIPTLKEIKDEISSKVRHQYEENPYPRWINTHLHAKTKSISEVIFDLDLRVIDEGKSFEYDHPKILVAGCGTGQHSINASSRYSSSQLLAIDLSLSSLAYAKRKTEELGVTNIEYMQADIMDLELLERKFDLIESSGVLHHMANPLEGWKVLTRCLKPGGLMKIGLYSERARRHIVLLRQEITDSQFSVNDADMRLFRSQLIKSELAHHKKILLSQDFYSLSALRDLLFHVKEKRFTLPMIRQALEGLGLKFCGFESKEIVRKFKAWCRENDAAYDLVKWDQFEEENPDTFTGMYLFWCQKIAESD